MLISYFNIWRVKTKEVNIINRLWCHLWEPELKHTQKTNTMAELEQFEYLKTGFKWISSY